MKIICIGRNYAEHAKELGNDLPESPVIFLKPDTALLKNNADFYYPSFSDNIQYETEIVIRINKEGKNIQEKFAHKYYNQIGIGIDFTARDIQQTLKSKGLPWEKAKAFNHSAPISSFVEVKEYDDIQALNFSLYCNDTLVQKGNTAQMIFNINYLISYISSFILLKTGDLIFTGTPAGVGSIKVGDRLKACIEEQEMLNFEVK